MEALKQTRALVYDIAPDVKLWRWLESDNLELVFDVGNGYITSYKSDDVGYFATILCINGLFKDHETAIKAINKGGLV